MTEQPQCVCEGEKKVVYLRLIYEVLHVLSHLGASCNSQNFLSNCNIILDAIITQ